MGRRSGSIEGSRDISQSYKSTMVRRYDRRPESTPVTAIRLVRLRLHPRTYRVVGHGLGLDRIASTARSGTGGSHCPGTRRSGRGRRTRRPLAMASPHVMPLKQSAGLLLFRRRGESLEVLLVHPGGPFWARKDDGAWSIPKGEVEQNEDVLAAARREVEEETGARPSGTFIPLPPVHQTGGKIVHVWAVESDFDPVVTEEQSVRDGMAAQVRQPQVVSRGRSRGLVRSGDCCAQDSRQSGDRPAAPGRAAHTDCRAGAIGSSRNLTTARRPSDDERTQHDQLSDGKRRLRLRRGQRVQAPAPSRTSARPGRRHSSRGPTPRSAT